MALSQSNKLEFDPASAQHQLLANFDLRALGAAFAMDGKANNVLSALKLGGRFHASLHEGFDPIDASSTGRVLESSGDVGVTLRGGSTAISLTAGGLSYRAGLDNPLASTSSLVAEASVVPALKVTIAKEFAEDSYAAISYDLTQRKPELALGWAGSTFTEQASLVLHADPMYKTYKISACAAFPGPEWRETVLDRERAVLEPPVDDGARHRLWVQHTIKDKRWGYRTRIGGAFDLGRILNYTAEQIDNKVEPRIPPMLWRIPLLHRIYNTLVPEQDNNQVRYRMSGWDLEASHEFGTAGSQLGLAKRFSLSTVRGSWHTGNQEAALQYAHKSGVSITARIARHDNAGWGAPALMLSVEPLGLL